MPASPPSGGSRHKKPAAAALPPAPASMAERDWAALPGDILFAIFLRLGHREIMEGAGRACSDTRRHAEQARSAPSMISRGPSVRKMANRMSPGSAAQSLSAMDAGAGGKAAAAGFLRLPPQEGEGIAATCKSWSDVEGIGMPEVRARCCFY